ncbi:MAG: TPM domain-containing protein [Xanthobacteraceae bacterium]
MLQLVVFIVAGLAFCWMPLRLWLVPRALQRARAHRAALEQFVVRSVSRTKNRTGVLIFVSLAEHYARVVADEGIAAKVQHADWQDAVDALTAHMHDGQITAGLVAAVEVAKPSWGLSASLTLYRSLARQAKVGRTNNTCSTKLDRS